MKNLKIILIVLILSQTTFVFSSSWVRVFGPPLYFGDGLLEGWIMVPSPTPSSSPSQEQVASLKELETLNKGVEATIQEVRNLKDTLMNYLQQMELSNLFDEIQSFWNECVDILDAKDAGAFDSEEHFQEVFQDLRQRMRAKIFLIIEKIRYEKARLYLEKVRAELITSGADIVTYSVKLTLAIKDYVLHSSQVICLLHCTLSGDPQFIYSISRLSEDLESFEEYHEEYVRGSWFTLSDHLLSKGDEAYFSGKILKVFGSESHIVHWQPDAHFGADRAWVTPLRMTSAPGAEIGDFSVFLEFQAQGLWRTLCASGESVPIMLDCADEESKWKPIFCPTSLTEDQSFLCMKHVKSGLVLTYIPSSENHGSLTVMPFDENNGNQLFNFTDVRRCCQISSSPSLVGNRKELCLGLTQISQEALVLTEDIDFFAYAACEAEVRLVVYEGRNFSKQTYTIAPGMQMSFGNPSEATGLRSYRLEGRAARLFTQENLTGDYTSIFFWLPNMEEKFLGKKISILVDDRPLVLYDEPDYTGNSMIIRRSMMNLDDVPFEVKSIGFL